MTEERNVDRRIKAWLDAHPNRAPDGMVANVLAAVDHSPQVGPRRRFGPFHWPKPAQRLSSTAVVLAVVLVVAGALLLRTRQSAIGPNESPPPAASALPTAAATATPAPSASSPAPSPSASLTQSPSTRPTPAPSASPRPTPIPSQLAAGVTGTTAAIATGDFHTCALSVTGTVKCWGRNDFGQLGDGTTTDRSLPVSVSGLTGVVAISAGGNATCALTDKGGVVCWGDNRNGGLGDGSTTQRSHPVGVRGLDNGVMAIAVGSGNACALTTAGGVKCWGANPTGDLGDGTDQERHVPVGVVGLASGVQAIAGGGGHFLAITTDGTVKSWGCNCAGQLGNGTMTDSNVPVDVVGLVGRTTAVTGGDVHSCALTAAGGARCWGQGSGGRLGNNAGEPSLVPVDVVGLETGVRMIVAGGLSTCAVTAAGGAKCWGDNLYGELGDNTSRDAKTPTDVSSLLSGLAAIDVGEEHACALTDGGGVLCWGDNEYGQLGTGHTAALGAIVTGSTPVPVLNL
jgi:alpha-tubulin suppressor-like RCC1 family protein